MRTLGKIVGTIALVILAGFVWWRIEYPTYTYRYRLTLEVEVDGSVKRGSIVIEVTRWWDPVPGHPISSYSTAAKGEAVYVDLGRAGNLFLLLTDDVNKNPEQLGAKTFHFDSTDTNDPIEQRRRADALTAKRATAELRPDQLPMLVTFSNLDDANAARIVRPDEFGQAFGADVRLRRAWIEMTSDPITRGIENKLPWWDKPKPRLRPLAGGGYVDTRTSSFRITKEMFKK